MKIFDWEFDQNSETKKYLYVARDAPKNLSSYNDEVLFQKQLLPLNIFTRMLHDKS